MTNRHRALYRMISNAQTRRYPGRGGPKSSASFEDTRLDVRCIA
ncbi:MAG: hypothetical protein ABWZ30_00855 [Jiangellaceae bacterium]